MIPKLTLVSTNLVFGMIKQGLTTASYTENYAFIYKSALLSEAKRSEKGTVLPRRDSGGRTD
jgi:hypothetical protein